MILLKLVLVLKVYKRSVVNGLMFRGRQATHTQGFIISLNPLKLRPQNTTLRHVMTGKPALNGRILNFNTVTRETDTRKTIYYL